MVTAPLQRGPERACWGGGVTIINGSPAMLMVKRTIGFILHHMLPMAAQTGPVSAGAPLFGLAHNHHGTHASQGHGCACVCVLKSVYLYVCACEPVSALAQPYSRESLIACFTELVVRVTDTPLMQHREVYFHFLGHIKAIEGGAGAAQTSWCVWVSEHVLVCFACICAACSLIFYKQKKKHKLTTAT